MNPDTLIRFIRSLVAEVVRSEVQAAVEAALLTQLPEVIRRAQYPEYMTREEAAAYIGRSVRSLDYLRKGTIPYIKRGGRVLVAVRDLDAFVAKGRVANSPSLNR